MASKCTWPICVFVLVISIDNNYIEAFKLLFLSQSWQKCSTSSQHALLSSHTSIYIISGLKILFDHNIVKRIKSERDCSTFSIHVYQLPFLGTTDYVWFYEWLICGVHVLMALDVALSPWGWVMNQFDGIYLKPHPSKVGMTVGENLFVQSIRQIFPVIHPPPSTGRSCNEYLSVPRYDYVRTTSTCGCGQ